ncbi:MAG: ATP-binding cassette domain-containing protein [Gammaproteobacteria bacterium]|nr:ATP-binding cassette domain-containing protein [Gammaproteobacteria bacterium]NIR84113.1 ATP-binding cassette domain-containing protein [Gammaproteobacteria bacterium]NIR89411.1 ATP-binding cassette domain-containing protein [Gammaproteobacteria bacterium]NIU07132.1 ATP-binding cassette domain-containing protein [Gammaproteobacteria bacterium]NIV74636.1 ATP-binding cassette domain-containing protein [Gammaproteobacteria bacterium]
MGELLRTEQLTKHFRGLVANEAVDFSLGEGELRAIIGPNGAGKTTFISMISGHLAPTSGEIWYRGKSVTGLSIPQRARLGIARKFQSPQLFGALSVRENLELAVLATPRPSAQRSRRIDEVLGLVRLSEHADVPADRLSHGQRQWLEVGLLIANDARLLLLDEPTAGMTAEETHATGELTQTLVREFGVSVIVIEHDINFIRDLRAPVTVLHLGRVLVEGSFGEIADDQQVREVYLGGSA